jgi:hypothetical protein
MQKHGGAIVNMVADMWNGMPGMGHSGAARAGMVNARSSRGSHCQSMEGRRSATICSRCELEALRRHSKDFC